MALEISAGMRHLEKIVTQEELLKLVAPGNRKGRVVFTNGCFDWLHPGHVRCLAAAREFGDILIVAVNSDSSVRRIKGDGRPLVPQQDRAEVLAALACVDYVTIFDEPTPRELIARVQPDVLAKGADWSPDNIVGREEVEAAGGQVVTIPIAEGYSTTRLIERIRQTPPAAQKEAGGRKS